MAVAQVLPYEMECLVSHLEVRRRYMSIERYLLSTSDPRPGWRVFESSKRGVD